MRTGLAMIGAGVVIINIFSSDTTSLIVGWAFIIAGGTEISESYRRLRRYQKKMSSITKQIGDK